jgi:hypothetical protein
MVARNIPVTFMKPANEVINDTIDPEETPRIMKAIPLHPSPKGVAAAVPSGSGGARDTSGKSSAKPPAEKTQNGPQPFSLRKEEQQKEKKNGE